MSSALSTGISELEPVCDYAGAGDWFSSERSVVVLKPGPHLAALQAERYATRWCTACGRRRGADGRCALCDPWWTSPFYVYGSLLTISVTVLLVTLVPLLRPASLDARASASARSGVPPAATVLAPTATSWENRSVVYSAPPMLPMYRNVTPATLPTVTTPVRAMPALLPMSSESAAMADLAKLRAMTDAAAGAETRRAAVRALTIAPPSSRIYLAGAGVSRPSMPTGASVPPLPAANVVEPASPPVDVVDADARSADAAQTL